MRLILAIPILLVAAACGTKGPLSLPPGTPPVPLLGYPKPPPPKPVTKPSADQNAAATAKEGAAVKDGVASKDSAASKENEAPATGKESADLSTSQEKR